MSANSFRLYFSPRVFPLMILGVASGLPLALTGATFQAWATISKVPLQEIGFLTLVGVAYTFKFLWAPLIDRFVPPFMGRRRGWMVVCQVLLGIILIIMGGLKPSQDLFLLALLATFVAFLSATQDIAFDAYSTEVLQQDERAAGAAIRTLGYRVGMIISGGWAMVIAQSYLGWGGMYMLMGVFMLCFSLVSWKAPETHDVTLPRNVYEAFVVPFKEFFSRSEAWGILLLIVCYKLGDSFAGALSTTFLLTGAGFSPVVVGSVTKILAVIATILGALIGGGLINYMGLYRSLMMFGLLQAFSNLAYWLVAVIPQNLPVMTLAIGVENICSGLGTAAFVVLVMGLCNVKYTATQFALLTALSSVGRVFLAGPLTPPLVHAFGWPNFFLLTVLISFPGLLILRLHKARITAIQG